MGSTNFKAAKSENAFPSKQPSLVSNNFKSFHCFLLYNMETYAVFTTEKRSQNSKIRSGENVNRYFKHKKAESMSPGGACTTSHAFVNSFTDNITLTCKTTLESRLESYLGVAGNAPRLENVKSIIGCCSINLGTIFKTDEKIIRETCEDHK
jgi:hypothetical protein